MADSPHKRWVRSPYITVDNVSQKPLVCENCKGDLFMVYVQKPMRKAGTVNRVGVFGKCAKCQNVVRIHSGTPR